MWVFGSPGLYNSTAPAITTAYGFKTKEYCEKVLSEINKKSKIYDVCYETLK